MNYRHAFHAGNHADVLKHVTLIACLNAMTAKPKPMVALDAFAGAGVYDLASEEATRSPEWRDGIGRLLAWDSPPDLVLPLIQAAQRGHYPGSPRLILDRLRAHDRLIGCDLHPQELAKLRTALGADARVHLHHRDGFQSLSALLPPPETRGLILVDPPYEKPDETARAVAALKAGAFRFRQGVFVWWRPEKPSLNLAAADATVLADTGLEWLRLRLAVEEPSKTSRLVASSMLVLNPPYGLAQAMTAVLPALATHLAIGPGAQATIEGP